jgi:hypothetical protein
MLLPWFSGITPTGRRSNQTITLPAASIHPIIGLVSRFPADNIGAGTHIPSYYKLPLLAKQEMLKYFGCLVFTEHAGTQD